MRKSKSIPAMIGTAVFIMLAVAACGMLAELEEGYNLVLTVQGQGNTRGISVDYFDVTRMEIEVRQPENNILETFYWYSSDQTEQYVVNLGDTGSYHLKVTHFSEVGGVEKAAEEWATFEIKNYVITMINIIPGAVGAIVVEPPPEEPACDLEGLWYGASVPFWDDENPFIDIYTWAGADNQYRTVLYPVGETDVESRMDFTNFGLFDSSDGLFSVDWEFGYFEGAWHTPDTYDFYTFDTPFTCEGDLLTMTQDLSEWDQGIYIWEMRRVEPYFDPKGIWTGSDLVSPHGFPISADLSLNDNGEYELIMYDGDPVSGILGFSSTGFWWTTSDEIVLDAVELYFSEFEVEDPALVGWYPASDIGGIGWNLRYQYVADQLVLEMDFKDENGTTATWYMNQLP